MIVRALAGDQASSSARLVDAVGAGAFRPALSDESLRELPAVVGYPRVESRIVSVARAFRAALDLGVMGEMYQPRRLDWPSLPDPRDWWMADLAYESRADYVVSWDPHLTGTEYCRCHWRSSSLPRCSTLSAREDISRAHAPRRIRIQRR